VAEPAIANLIDNLSTLGGATMAENVREQAGQSSDLLSKVMQIVHTTPTITKWYTCHEEEHSYAAQDYETMEREIAKLLNASSVGQEVRMTTPVLAPGVVSALRTMRRYRLSAGSLDEYTSCISEEETALGDWIRADDVDTLIAERKDDNGKVHVSVHND